MCFHKMWPWHSFTSLVILFVLFHAWIWACMRFFHSGTNMFHHNNWVSLSSLPHRWTPEDTELHPTSGNLWGLLVCRWSVAPPLQSAPARSNSEYLQSHEEHTPSRSTCAGKAGEPGRLITEGLLACRHPPDLGPLCLAHQMGYQVYCPHMFHLRASEWAQHLLCCHSLDYNENNENLLDI